MLSMNAWGLSASLFRWACVIVVSVEGPLSIKICRLDHIRYIGPFETGNLGSRMHLFVSRAMNLDNEILLVSLSLCFGLANVVHRALRLFALVLHDKVDVLMTAFLEAGEALVVKELIIIGRVACYLAVFQDDLRIVERRRSHESAVS